MDDIDAGVAASEQSVSHAHKFSCQFFEVGGNSEWKNPQINKHRILLHT